MYAESESMKFGRVAATFVIRTVQEEKEKKKQKQKQIGTHLEASPLTSLCVIIERTMSSFGTCNEIYCDNQGFQAKYVAR